MACVEDILDILACLDLPYVDTEYVKEFLEHDRVILLARPLNTVLLWKPLSQVKRSWAANGKWTCSAPAEDVGCICEVAVKDGERNKGMGTAAIKIAMEEMADRGYHDLVLSVMSSNEGAIRLYKSLGFAVVHTFEYTPELRLNIMFRKASRNVSDMPTASERAAL